MIYEPQNFDHLLGTPGFSDQLFKNHFTLYQGYVNNTNKLSEALSEDVELKRRFGWEFNGMRLHEYYFGNITKKSQKVDQTSKFYQKIVSNFGSWENWEKDFKATGTMRGIGWTMLYFDPSADHFFNVWINEHDLGHLAGAAPLLVMDVFEHAYMLDYGLKRADYIEVFFKVLDWKTINSRFNTIAR